MQITQKNSFDELKNPGDWLEVHSHAEKDADRKFAGIAIMCVCGDVVSLSNTVHQFESLTPLTISPSILHKRDDAGLKDCHYFIKEGKYIQA